MLIIENIDEFNYYSLYMIKISSNKIIMTINASIVMVFVHNSHYAIVLDR